MTALSQVNSNDHPRPYSNDIAATHRGRKFDQETIDWLHRNLMKHTLTDGKSGNEHRILPRDLEWSDMGLDCMRQELSEMINDADKS
jgi:hypothetical protein